MKTFNFDYITLDLFLKENKDFFVGSRLQKIQQPSRKELVFTMRNIGETRKFYVNINPRFFHICFMSKENEQKRFIQIPKSPPMFCMQLRKYLEGSRIAKVLQPDGERILEFYFETYDEIGEKIYLCLAVELMGKHSNVVLYNFDTNVIIGCAHNVGSDKSRERELIGGLPYVYPRKVMRKDFVGFSSCLENFDNINGAIDNFFANLQFEDKIKSLKSSLKLKIQAKLKRITVALEKIKKQGVNEQKAQKYLKYGDLIMANLFQLKDFSEKISLMDYETNSLIFIELDSTKSLKENANRFYKLYNKSKTANAKSLEIIQHHEIEKKQLEQILYSIESAQSVEDLLEIEDEIAEAKCKMQNAKSSKQKAAKQLSSSAAHNILTVKIKDFDIYVGKNNKQNDYIVSKLARPNDVWFHVQNCAGSHVLLRVEAGQKVTDEVIFECAKVAKEYSSAKLSTKAGVIYTLAKNLKKPPASPLGYVTYKGEEEIIV